LFYKSAIKIPEGFAACTNFAMGASRNFTRRTLFRWCVCRAARGCSAWLAIQTTGSFKITVCGIEELTEHCEARVSHVVSILDPTWPVPSALDTYREHERLELRFDDIIEPVPGKAPPGPEHIRQLLGLGRRLMGEPAATPHRERRPNIARKVLSFHEIREQRDN
jgi:hypothetical protein